jgi:DNA primase
MRAADRAVEVALRNQIEVRVAVMPDGLDPAECVIARGAEGFEACLNSSTEALEFKWSRALAAFGAGDSRRRRIAVDELVSFVARVVSAGGVDPLEQGFLIGRLSELLSVPQESIYAKLSAARRRQRLGKPDHAEQSGDSEYESSLRGISPAIVAAVESAIGCILVDSCCYHSDDAVINEAVAMNRTWQGMFRLFDDLAERSGNFGRDQVEDAADSAALLELLDCAGKRVGAPQDVAEAFGRARERLTVELEAQQMSELRGQLRDADPASGDADEAFRSFLDMARRQNSPIAVERRANTS